MQLNEDFLFDATVTGLRVKAKLDDTGLLSVSVQRRTYVRDVEKKVTNWFWLFVSTVTVYLPISKAEAMRVVYHHLALHDQALIPTTAPIWELWDHFPEKIDAPPQGHALN